ncbi:MAG: glutathione S-transferase family protein [Rhodobacteraceae bacterium]|nr:glutathione S-transferase family protein [Paracoccaceae bacterium]
MYTLLTYPSGFGSFSLSPFCVKAAYLLALSGQPWKRQDTLDPRKMPHSKLPVLRTKERMVSDSDSIRLFLESQGADFDPGLSDMQKAQSQALIRMAEDSWYFHLVLDRWGNDDVWPIIRETFFGQIPALLRRPITNNIRKPVLKGLNAQGISRFSESERMQRIERDLQALNTYLLQSPFLMGDQPTAADLSVAPMLAGMRKTPEQTPLSCRIRKDKVLTDYLDRIEQAIPLP